MAYTETSRIWIPEVLVQETSPDHKYVALRGYAHTQAVVVGEECIGWIETATLEASK